MVVPLQPYLDEISKATTANDAKDRILNWIGKDYAKEFNLLGDQVMVATYARPNKTSGGIWLSDNQKQEDQFQGVVGLLLAAGPNAFIYDGQFKLIERQDGESEAAYRKRWKASVPQVLDWVVAKPPDGFNIAFRKASVRIFKSECILGIAKNPIDYY